MLKLYNAVGVTEFSMWEREELDFMLSSKNELSRLYYYLCLINVHL